MSLSDGSKYNEFSEAVLNWFQNHGRKNLPWQLKPNPYRVWVSEIMLQQTQVATVIPYYKTFIKRFSEIKKLAQASEDKVLHHWTGLGYYARARNLHKTAKLIFQEYQGVFPTTLEELVELPGIGRSTAGAILALADDKHAVILDGNVKRVLCRFHCIKGWPGLGSAQKQLWDLAQKYTPANNCRNYTQAMMDIGATLCTRSNPQCNICPLQLNCQAHLTHRTAEFPHKKLKKKLPVKAIQMLILHNKNAKKVLLEKRPPYGIWGGLWSFPETQVDDSISSFLQHYGFIVKDEIISWNNIRHTFSHFHLDIKPQVLTLNKEPAAIMEKPNWHWYDLNHPAELGLAAPVKALLKKLGN